MGTAGGYAWQDFCCHICVLYHRHHHSWHATLRLRSAIRRQHPPQRAVLGHICYFGERKMVLSQILLDDG